MLARLRFPRTG